MASFTIDLSRKTVNKLKSRVQSTNENEGRSLTVRQWITLHLQELAIADELAVTVEALTRQYQQEAEDALKAAIRAARDDALKKLGK